MKPNRVHRASEEQNDQTSNTARPLTELNPSWLSAEGRQRVGVVFDSPTNDGSKIAVYFSNPDDGQPGIPGHTYWDRKGESFGTLVLSPSIQSTDWHGFVGGQNGDQPGMVVTI